MKVLPFLTSCDTPKPMQVETRRTFFYANQPYFTTVKALVDALREHDVILNYDTALRWSKMPIPDSVNEVIRQEPAKYIVCTPNTENSPYRANHDLNTKEGKLAALDEIANDRTAKPSERKAAIELRSKIDGTLKSEGGRGTASERKQKAAEDNAGSRIIAARKRRVQNSVEGAPPATPPT